jgi:hypothetical protein
VSARVWTREELDSVHTLPEADDDDDRSWRWRLEADGCHVAVGWHDDHDGVEGEHLVWVGKGGWLRSVCGDYEVPPPATVALAVILASQGLDSREAMATEMDKRRDQTLQEAFGYAAKGEMDMSAACDGEANSYYEAAAMLRRGTVQS